MTTPLIKGGQGRSDVEILDAAQWLTYLFGFVAAIAIIIFAT